MKRVRVLLLFPVFLASLFALGMNHFRIDVTYFININSSCIPVTFTEDPCPKPEANNCTFDFPFYGVKQLYVESACAVPAKRI